MPKPQDFKSTEVLVDGGIGGVRSVTVDSADYTPDVFASDWLSAISLPARPASFVLDMATGIIVGSTISHTLLLISSIWSPLFGFAFGSLIIFILTLIFKYVLSLRIKWYILSVWFRVITLLIGFISIFIFNV